MQVHFNQSCQHGGDLGAGRLLMANGDHVGALALLVPLATANRFQSDVERASCAVSVAYCRLQIGELNVVEFENVLAFYVRYLMGSNRPSGEAPDYPTVAEFRAWLILIYEQYRMDPAYIDSLRQEFMEGLPDTPEVRAHHLLMQARQAQRRNLAEACAIAQGAFELVEKSDRPCLREGVGRVLIRLLADHGNTQEAQLIMRRAGIPAEVTLDQVLQDQV